MACGPQPFIPSFVVVYPTIHHFIRILSSTISIREWKIWVGHGIIFAYHFGSFILFRWPLPIARLNIYFTIQVKAKVLEVLFMPRIPVAVTTRVFTGANVKSAPLGFMLQRT
jgi:hypothetical protein